MPSEAQPIIEVGGVMATSSSPLGSGKKKRGRKKKVRVVDTTLMMLGKKGRR
jgi:hypothetical protein